jgi:hypothetical protein
LVNDDNLKQFSGMVCSPLNYSESEVAVQISSLPDSFQSILDPQLYFPKSERGKLRTWEYFPNDFDSADQTNFNWWKTICDILINTCERVGASHVCSPCVVPAKFSSDYYKFCVDVGNYIYGLAQQQGKGSYQTAIIDYNTIKDAGEAEMIASILSQTDGESIYLILRSDIEPRRELSDSDSLTGVMKLIRLLKDTEINVFVGFCSSEFVLWKYAGAEMLATGKFFNLRRFTSSRFDEPSGGGGQLPYWFEKNLMAYLREGDLIRLKNENMLHPDYRNNPFSLAILDHLEKEPGSAWLGLSWKNYLYTFADMEKSLTTEEVKQLLINAEDNWRKLDDKNILMEELRNDGAWIRLWRIALNSFDKALI